MLVAPVRLMNHQVLIEVCVDSVGSAIAAERGGASRVELCSDLLEGGVTPGAGLIEAVRSSVRIPLHVMIRPRPGDFHYSDEEFDVMRRDIAFARSLRADGIALGILHTDGRIDVDRTRALVDVARPLSVTFHRAFDMTSDLTQALKDVQTAGVNRILTSGGEAGCLQGSENIASLRKHANGNIAVMAGGGIRAHNAAEIIERTGVREIHVGLATSSDSPMVYRNSRVPMGKLPDREYTRSQVQEEDVRELRRAIS